MCCGLYAIDAVAHLNGIQIHFHDALLAPDVLDEEGEVGLQTLAHPAVARPQEHILGGLLRDGAGTAFAATAQGFEPGQIDLFEVEAMVLFKQVVLAGNHCLGHVVGDAVEGYPLVVDGGVLAGEQVACAFHDHERRVIHRHPLEHDHGGDARHKEEYQGITYPAQYFLENVHNNGFFE